MKLQRDWITPLTLGSFFLIAATGVLMFFHLDTAMNKTVHEWLGWALLAAVVAHGASNWLALKRHLTGRRGQVLVGVFVLLLGLSFIPLPGASSEPPFVAPLKALGAAPVSALAAVAGVPAEQMRARLAAAGVAVQADSQSLNELLGPDTKRQVGVLRKVLAPAPAAVR
jgi:hypothetical protein